MPRPSLQRRNSCVPDESCDFLQRESMTIFVAGASGNLSKKKTYPSLFNLYRHSFLAPETIICGYARSSKSDEDFRKQIGAYLKGGTEEEKEAFLNLCIYRHGQYDSVDDIASVFDELSKIEEGFSCAKSNRIFYFAIPPTVFAKFAKPLKEAVISKSEADPAVGWSRLIIEKPFGEDLASFELLNTNISALYTEDEIYRIDHYLGKEMVQNLMVLRFSNAIFEPLWNRDHIKSVTITFKENFGTEGRGGYFDNFGIIRDVIQNHLLQVLSLMAMEPPVALTDDPEAANYVRNEKVKVLNCIDPVKLEDTVIGQYLAPENGSEPGYTEDPTVPDDSVTPTFATIVLWVNNPRWDGVPFIVKAGKALDERKGEIRIQFKDPPGASKLFAGEECSPNELVLRLQPDEDMYMKINVKNPGLKTCPLTSELDLNYKSRYGENDFDAYTRLILEVIRGRQATFVRDDELRAAWKIFTPLLHRIENEKIKPIPYKYGSRGPAESDEMIDERGYYKYHGGSYKWKATK